jgi:putative membrane protein
MAPSSPDILSEADHQHVSKAVAAAESHTAGEIVTIVTDRSDGYSDIALAWAGFVAFTSLTALSLAPQFYLSLCERVFGEGPRGRVLQGGGRAPHAWPDRHSDLLVDA